MIGLFLFGIPAAIIAKVKGFRALRWLLALGVIGFVWVLCLASAKAEGITPEETAARSEKADTVGAWLLGINVGLTALILLVVLSIRA